MRILLLVITLALAPASASAQEASPTLFRDRVAQMQDTAALRQLEREYLRVGDADAAVAAGLTALRLWEVTGERMHARRSRNHFDQAAGRDPGSAWAHYGHALSLQADMDRDAPRVVAHVNASRALGLDPVSRARRALERAVALDPTLPGAVDLLATYAAETRDTDGLLVARSAFERSAAQPGADRATLLGLASTARELRDYTAAAAAARRAIAVNPNASGTAWAALARALASIPDSLNAAGDAYNTALAHADDVLLEILWRDAAVLASDTEAAAWAAAQLSADRVHLLRTFWDVRGALAAVSAGERAAEHYRRLALARHNFPRHGMYGAAPLNALLLKKIDEDFDDRGVIYVRHGRPELVYDGSLLHDYTVWFYSDDAGDRLSFHFVRHNTAGFSRDYILVRQLPCPLDPAIAAHDSRLSSLTRQRCDPSMRHSVSMRIARQAERALTSDSHRPLFIAGVPFHYDAYTFRGADGTDLLMSVGVPLEQLPRGERSLRVGLSLVDTAAGAVQRTSTITERLEHASEPGRFARVHLLLTAAPARAAAYRVDVRDAADPRIGGVYGSSIELRDYSGDTLLVSDIVLAEPTDDGRFERAGQRLALAPAQVFRDGDLRVYYEIYNLAPGAAYRTEVRVQRADRGVIARLFGRGDGVQLQFEDAVPIDSDGTLREMRDVHVPFAPGEYTLSITVAGPDGARVERQRRFTIRESSAR